MRRATRACLLSLLLGSFGVGSELASQGSLPEKERRFQAAQQHKDQGRTDLALKEFQDLAAESNAHGADVKLRARALRALAEVQLERNEQSKAADSFARSLTLDASPGIVHYELGLVYRNLGNDRGAAVELQAAIDRGFRNTGVLYFLAESCFASRQYAAALDRAKELIATAAQAPELMMRVGRLLLMHLYYREALDAFKLAHDAKPEDYQARFYLALTNYLLSNNSETIALLSPLPNPDLNPELTSLLASAHARRGEYEMATQMLRAASEKSPLSPHPYLNLALIALEQNDFDEAERELNRLQALGGKSAAKVFFTVSRNTCGEMLQESSGRAGAVYNPEKALFLNVLSAQMQASHHYASALQLMRLTLHYQPASGRLLYAAGLNCFNIGAEPPVTTSLLERAVVLEPALADAWHLLGRTYLRRQEFSKAIATLSRAVALKPSAGFYTSLGKAYIAKGQPFSAVARSNALSAFRKAVELDPNDATAQYEIGSLYAQMDQLDDGRRHLIKATELEPDLYQAYYLLGSIYSRSGDAAQAHKYIVLFQSKRKAAQEHAVLNASLLSEGRE